MVLESESIRQNREDEMGGKDRTRSVYWTHQSQVIDQWRARFKRVINLRDPQTVGNVLTSSVTISF
jgi:hypothetical protein